MAVVPGFNPDLLSAPTADAVEPALENRNVMPQNGMHILQHRRRRGNQRNHPYQRPARANQVALEVAPEEPAIPLEGDYKQLIKKSEKTLYMYNPM